MNYTKTITFALLLTVSAVPFAGAAEITDEERNAIVRSLEESVSDANQSYKAGYGVRELQKKSEKLVEETAEKMKALEKKKAGTRRSIVALRKTVADVKERYGIDLMDTEQVANLMEEERESVLTFVRYLSAQRFIRSSESVAGRAILRQTFVASLGERIEEDLRLNAVAQARARFFSFLVNIQTIPETLEDMKAQHQEYLAEYEAARQEHLEAKEKVNLSREQLATIKRTVNEVHQQILRLQGDLADIDYKLRLQAEQVLIEKGLKSPRAPGEELPEDLSPVGIQWPVYGYITAGYLEPAYRSYFGVSHKGIDIAVPQGSSVHAASDGVVFLARDGGKFGYSYILIGHKDGYATLYGHVSEIHVGAGQFVKSGEQIGLSGGEPGTYGAGPMTTGAHVHFEVMKDGEHINPLLMLPKSDN